MRFTAVQRIINDEWGLATYLEFALKYIVRITCVFNAFLTRIQQVQKRGR